MIKFSKKRIVVTGIGVVTSIGVGRERFWNSLMEGKSGISRIEDFNTDGYNRYFAGEIKNFDPKKFVNKRRVDNMGRTSQLAIAASRLAIQDAHFKISDLRKVNTGVSLGTTAGELRVLEKFHDAEQLNKSLAFRNLIDKYPASSLSVNVSIEFKLKGKNFVIATACAAGNYAIGYACDLIRAGEIDCALAGGADSISRIVFTGFARLNSIAQEKCSPFDISRQGMIPGEGAGVLFLESLEKAKKRGANIYCEVLDYGLSCDGNHMTIPSVSGVQSAIELAIRNSSVKKEDINYVCAHGTGTKENDKVECEALSRVFKKKLKEIPVSSIKSMLGHTMGAAAAIEAAACCLAIKEGMIPPTINCFDIDPECDIDCVPNKCRVSKLNIVLNNSQAFGGNNSCLVLSKVR